METLVTVIHVIVCLFLVLVVLLQAGKGGGMGIAFGGAGGGGGSVFGGSGAGNFLTKLTVISAFMFMVTSMSLAYMASTSGDDPLKALSAKSREAAQEREKQREQILNPDEEVEPIDGSDIDPGEIPPVEGMSVPEAAPGAEAEPEAEPAAEPEAEPAAEPAAEPEPAPEPAPAGAADPQ